MSTYTELHRGGWGVGKIFITARSARVDLL